MKRSAVVPRSSYRYYSPGAACLDPVPGDIILVRDKSKVAGAIRLAERLRAPADFCWCNHVAVVLTAGPHATISQEGAHGNVVTPLADLDMDHYAVINIDCVDDQRHEAVTFANWSLSTGYSFLSIAADLFNAVTGVELGLSLGNHMVCSTSGCRTAERMGLIPDRSPSAVTPAHMAQYFDVVQPA